MKKRKIIARNIVLGLLMLVTLLSVVPFIANAIDYHSAEGNMNNPNAITAPARVYLGKASIEDMLGLRFTVYNDDSNGAATSGSKLGYSVNILFDDVSGTYYMLTDLNGNYLDKFTIAKNESGNTSGRTYNTQTLWRKMSSTSNNTYMYTIPSGSGFITYGGTQVALRYGSGKQLTAGGEWVNVSSQNLHTFRYGMDEDSPIANTVAFYIKESLRGQYDRENLALILDDAPTSWGNTNTMKFICNLCGVGYNAGGSATISMFENNDKIVIEPLFRVYMNGNKYLFTTSESALVQCDAIRGMWSNPFVSIVDCSYPDINTGYPTGTDLTSEGETSVTIQYFQLANSAAYDISGLDVLDYPATWTKSTETPTATNYKIVAFKVEQSSEPKLDYGRVCCGSVYYECFYTYKVAPGEYMMAFKIPVSAYLYNFWYRGNDTGLTINGFRSSRVSLVRDSKEYPMTLATNNSENISCYYVQGVPAGTTSEYTYNVYVNGRDTDKDCYVKTDANGWSANFTYLATSNNVWTLNWYAFVGQYTGARFPSLLFVPKKSNRPDSYFGVSTVTDHRGSYADRSPLSIAPVSSSTSDTMFWDTDKNSNIARARDLVFNLVGAGIYCPAENAQATNAEATVHIRLDGENYNGFNNHTVRLIKSSVPRADITLERIDGCEYYYGCSIEEAGSYTVYIDGVSTGVAKSLTTTAGANNLIEVDYYSLAVMTYIDDVSRNPCGISETRGVVRVNDELLTVGRFRGVYLKDSTVKIDVNITTATGEEQKKTESIKMSSGVVKRYYYYTLRLFTDVQNGAVIENAGFDSQDPGEVLPNNIIIVQGTMTTVNNTIAVLKGSTVNISQDESTKVLTLNINNGAQSVASSVVTPMNGYWGTGWKYFGNAYEGELTPTGTTSFVINAAQDMMLMSRTTIIYDANGGDGGPSPQEYGIDTNITLSTTKPERAGYEPAGWKVAASVGNWVAGTVYAAGEHIGTGKYGNVTLVAQWAPNEYTNRIYHYPFVSQADGTSKSRLPFVLGETSYSVHCGETYYLGADKAVSSLPNGYYLSERFGTTWITGTWGSYDMATTEITQGPQGISVEYFYYPCVYNITYNLNGGTNNASNPAHYSVLHGATFAAPTNDGYVFAGWYIDGVAVTGVNEGDITEISSASSLYINVMNRKTGDVTVEARWTAETPLNPPEPPETPETPESKTYTITYDDNGATTAHSGGDTSYKITTETVNLPVAPQKTGYKFMGWKVTVAGDQDKEPKDPSTYFSIDTVYLNSPIARDKAYGDVVLTAQWEPNSYTIAYDDNGATTAHSGGDTSYKITTETVNLPVAPQKTGYKFMGWKVTVAGDQDKEPKDSNTYFSIDTVYINSPIIRYKAYGYTKLVAQWELNSYTIAYDDNGVTTSRSGGDISYTIETKEVTLPTVSDTDKYKFKGWKVTYAGDQDKATKDPNTYFSTDAVYNSDKITRDRAYGYTRLTAQWEIKTYTIVWQNYDGTELEEDTTVPYGATPSYDGATPTRSGVGYTYAFDGWSPSISIVVGNAIYIATYKESANIVEISINKDGEVWSNSKKQIALYSGNVEMYRGGTGNGYFLRFYPVPEGEYIVYAQNSVGNMVPVMKNDATILTVRVSGGKVTEEVNYYTVSFNNNGYGNTPEDQVVLCGGNATRPADPLASGYTFDGWYKDIACENIYNFADMVVERTVLYAHWKTNITITANNDEFTYDGTPHTVDGWTSNIDLGTATITCTSGVTETNAGIYAHALSNVKIMSGTNDVTDNYAITLVNGRLTINPYIIYNGNGATSGYMENYPVGYNIATPIEENRYEKNGHSFSRWLGSDGNVYENCEDITVVSNTVMLTAQWNPNDITNTITHWAFGFVNGEGNNGGANNRYNLGSTYVIKKTNEIYTLTAADAITIPNGFYLEQGFVSYNIFGSWALVPFGTSITQLLTPASFEYRYYPVTYDIVYNLNGGTNNASNPDSYNVLYGVTFNAPTRAGYTFAGWYIDGVAATGINEGTNNIFADVDDLYAKLGGRVAKDVTVEARWTPIEYTLFYDVNGGEGGPSALSYTIETNITISATAPTRTGYSFTGWKVAAAVGNWVANTAYTKGQNVGSGKYGNVTLVAQWTSNVVTITIKKDGADWNNSGKRIKLYLGSEEKYNGGTGSGCFMRFLTVPNGTYTVYAQDSNNVYSRTNIVVNVDNNSPSVTVDYYTLTVSDGHGTTGSIVNVVDAEITINNPEREGYTFVGWMRDRAWNDVGAYLPFGTLGTKSNGLINGYNNRPLEGVLVKEYVLCDSTNPVSNSVDEYQVRIRSVGQTVPGRGGFYNAVQTEANSEYIHTFIAKLPEGFTFNYHSNSVGDNPERYWLTSNAGTGEWEVYSYYLKTSSTGTFSTFGYVAAYGGDYNTELVWYLAQSSVFKLENVGLSTGPAMTYEYGNGGETITAMWAKCCLQY